MENGLFVKIIFGIPAILLALTVHEFFHGWTAWQFGDPTAKYENRLTLNPIAHLDPIGAGMLLVTMLFFGFPMGWAKPVPVVTANLANPRINLPLVALAGPVSNLVLAFFAGLIYKFSLAIPIVPYFFLYFAMVNIGLALFNLLPVPPLDGWKIIQIFIPADLSDRANYFISANPHVSMIALAVVVWLSGYILMVPYTILYNLFIG